MNGSNGLQSLQSKVQLDGIRLLTIFGPYLTSRHKDGGGVGCVGFVRVDWEIIDVQTVFGVDREFQLLDTIKSVFEQTACHARAYNFTFDAHLHHGWVLWIDERAVVAIKINRATDHNHGWRRLHLEGGSCGSFGDFEGQQEGGCPRGQGTGDQRRREIHRVVVVHWSIEFCSYRSGS